MRRNDLIRSSSVGGVDQGGDVKPVITIVEPQSAVRMLWGKQSVLESATYRMMRYVLRVDHDNIVLLLNVVSGHLIVLNHDEMIAIDKLPKRYAPILEPLARYHFIVPEMYDEHSIVSSMRSVLRKVNDAKQKPDLTFYTILPTTACNARCYYCFQKGMEFATMTRETAEDVIRFITKHCNGKKVWLKWFGGEPTVAANRITQICYGLKQNGISFSSIMTTNGYLFDEKMALEARQLWNLKQITLSMDGTGQNYNRIKDFIGACENPYERVLHNIGGLTEQGIRVHARMNFDQTNFKDFENLLSDIREMYPHNPFLELRAHYINDVQIVNGVPRYHGSDNWYRKKILELNQLSQSAGFLHKKKYLPSLSYRWCPAASLRSVTITPQGNLVSCYELLYEVKGNVREGITDRNIAKSWLKYADEAECSKCVFFPYCDKIEKCPRKHKCYRKGELLSDTKDCVINTYNSLCT